MDPELNLVSDPKPEVDPVMVSEPVEPDLALFVAKIEGAPLTPPEGFPKERDQYADPTNFKYPVHDLAHANNARVRFIQQKGEPYSDADKAKVYRRIVEAQLKHGAHPMFDPDSSMDKMLPESLRSKMKHADMSEQRDMADKPADPDPECEIMARFLYSMLACSTLEDQDRAFVQEQAAACDKGKELARDVVQRLRGIAASLPIAWPMVSKPMGLPVEEGTMQACPSPSYRYGEVNGVPAVVSFRDVGSAETYNIPGVEIFATGTYHGEAWTSDHIDQIVRNFHELHGSIRVPIKLGHDNTMLQNDSMPAIGWVENVRRHGEKIVGDLVRVPRVVRDLIQQKAYSRVSSEVYLDYVDGQTKRSYGKVLRAVALLGAALPEVKCLQDITLLYREARASDVASLTDVGKRVWLDFSEPKQPTGGTNVSQEELDSLRKKLEESERAKAEALGQVKALERQRLDNQINTFFTEMVGKGILVPAQEQQVKGFLKALTSEQVQSFSENGKTAFDMARELFGSLRPQVSFSEQIPASQPNIGATPGAPKPEATKPDQKVVTFTDGLGREYGVSNVDTMEQVREFRSKNPSASIEDAVIAIDRAKRGGSWML